jgi:hypothetical protein
MGRKTEEIIDDIMSNLPSYYPNSPGTGNYQLILPIAKYIDSTDDDIQTVKDAIDVKEVDDIETLARLGKLVNTVPRENEGLEHYRARVMAEYALSTCEATIEDVLVNAANILNVSPESITYNEPVQGEYGTVELSFPQRAISDSALTDTELSTILDRLLPASYRIDTFIPGSFEYITPTDYNSNNHDSTKGYDGLDANGNPKDNGGTYAGVL